MKIFIKNMVSLRCKLLVKSELEKLGIAYKHVELGEADLEALLSNEQQQTLKAVLAKSGLELMDDKKAMLVEKVKEVIIEMVHYADEFPETHFSDFLSKKLKHNYKYLSNLFSEVKGTTIEHFIIIHKIEKVKELIIYDELSLTEIAYKMNYSSVAHLSNQFKKVTGLTPTFFRKMKNYRRSSLEDM